MEDVVKFIMYILAIIAIVAILALLAAFPTMWLMNYLFAPSFLEMVFGISQLTFWKAFWLNLLMGILVKSSCSSSSSKK